jgi:hypothetical protein
MYKILGSEKVYIIEIKIYPVNSNWQIYSLYVDSERPVYFDKCPIIFFQLENAPKALSIANCGAEILPLYSNEVFCEFDFFQAVNDLMNSDKRKVSNCSLLNCLQLIEDYYFDTVQNNKKNYLQPQKNDIPIKSDSHIYKIPVSAESISDDNYFQKILAASFYLFNHDDIDTFVIEYGCSRKELLQAIELVIGMVALSAKYVL